MKKQLFLYAAIVAALGASAQASRKPIPSSSANMGSILSQKYFSPALKKDPVTKLNSPTSPNELNTSEKSASSAAITWSVIAGSRNIYGVLNSESRPLQYNETLDAVSFIHRASDSYIGQPSVPGSQSGAIVAEVTSNWGASWDSTCFWSDPVNWGRYPQGAIYNPIGNTVVAQAYIVGSGPVNDGTNWVGSWYASKQLSAANNNNTASATPGAQQFLSNSAPLPAFGKHDYAAYSFSSSDDGIMRSAGIICQDINGTTNLTFGLRGAMITKGTFNAGTFTWTGDSLVPATVLRGDNTKQLWSVPYTAWSQSGEYGYVMLIGASATATNSNKGWQPIIWKTSNFGNSWSPVSGIDFNAAAMNSIKNSIISVETDSNLVIPFFNVGEGISMTVDKNNKLHIFTTIVGTFSNHNDSLGYTGRFRADNYSWPHTPGRRAYLYDFVGDGASPWEVITVDTMFSEGCGANSGDPGYTENPWDADAGYKPSSGGRLQVSRTNDGAYIVYNWAESDSAFTDNFKLWNTIPNIKARCLMVGNTTHTMLPGEINVSRPGTNVIGLSNHAWFHYASPVNKFIGITTGQTPSVQIQAPYTSSNTFPTLSQLTQNRHWFSNAQLSFAMTAVGLKEEQMSAIRSMELFPNPSSEKVKITFNLKSEGKVQIDIYNAIGQKIKSISTTGNAGGNETELTISELPAGVYIVQALSGNTRQTVKLIKE